MKRQLREQVRAERLVGREQSLRQQRPLGRIAAEEEEAQLRDRRFERLLVHGDGIGGRGPVL